MTVNVWPTEYLVSVLDEDDPNRHTWGITVSLRAPGRYAVTHYGRCLRHDGKRWAWETGPSSRTDRFKRAYRMDLETAITLARKHAPLVTVNGYTATDLVRNER